MFYFHHLSFLNELPSKANRIMLDPAFWNESEGGEKIQNFTASLKSTDGQKLENATEFVVTNASAILPLSHLFTYLFFLISEVEYAHEMPAFHSDEWDKTLKIDDLITLGWTVYAFQSLLFCMEVIL